MNTATKLGGGVVSVLLAAGIIGVVDQDGTITSIVEEDLTCTQILEQASDNSFKLILAKEEGDKAAISTAEARSAQFVELANAQGCREEWLAKSPPVKTKAEESPWKKCGSDLDCRQSLIKSCRKDTGQTRDACKESLKNA